MRAAIHVFSGRIRETLFFPLGTGCHVISPSLAPKRGGGGRGGGPDGRHGHLITGGNGPTGAEQDRPEWGDEGIEVYGLFACGAGGQGGGLGVQVGAQQPPPLT